MLSVNLNLLKFHYACKSSSALGEHLRVKCMGVQIFGVEIQMGLRVHRFHSLFPPLHLIPQPPLSPLSPSICILRMVSAASLSHTMCVCVCVHLCVCVCSSPQCEFKPRSCRYSRYWTLCWLWWWWWSQGSRPCSCPCLCLRYLTDLGPSIEMHCLQL